MTSPVRILLEVVSIGDPDDDPNSVELDLEVMDTFNYICYFSLTANSLVRFGRHHHL